MFRKGLKFELAITIAKRGNQVGQYFRSDRSFNVLLFGGWSGALWAGSWSGGWFDGLSGKRIPT